MPKYISQLSSLPNSHSAKSLAVRETTDSSNKIKNLEVSQQPDESQEHLREVENVVSEILYGCEKELQGLIAEIGGEKSQIRKISQAVYSFWNAGDVLKFFQSTLGAELCPGLGKIKAEIEAEQNRAQNEMVLHAEELCKEVEKDPPAYHSSLKQMQFLQESLEKLSSYLATNNRAVYYKLKQVYLEQLELHYLYVLDAFFDQVPGSQFGNLSREDRLLLGIWVHHHSNLAENQFMYNNADIKTCFSGPLGRKIQKTLSLHNSEFEALKKMAPPLKQKIASALLEMEPQSSDSKPLIDELFSLLNEEGFEGLIDELVSFKKAVSDRYLHDENPLQKYLESIFKAAAYLSPKEKIKAVSECCRYLMFELKETNSKPKELPAIAIQRHELLTSEAAHFAKCRGTTGGELTFKLGFRDLPLSKKLYDIIQSLSPDAPKLLGSFFCYSSVDDLRRVKPAIEFLYKLNPKERVEALNQLNKRLQQQGILSDKGFHYLNIICLPSQVLQELDAKKIVSEEEWIAFVDGKLTANNMEEVVHRWRGASHIDEMETVITQNIADLGPVLQFFRNLYDSDIPKGAKLRTYLERIAGLNVKYQEKLTQFIRYAQTNPLLFNAVVAVLKDCPYPQIWYDLMGWAEVDPKQAEKFADFLKQHPEVVAKLRGIALLNPAIFYCAETLPEPVYVFLLDLSLATDPAQLALATEYSAKNPAGMAKIAQIEKMDGRSCFHIGPQFSVATLMDIPHPLLDVMLNSRAVRDSVRQNGLSVFTNIAIPTEFWEQAPELTLDVANYFTQEQAQLSLNEEVAIKSVLKKAVEGNPEAKKALEQLIKISKNKKSSSLVKAALKKALAAGETALTEAVGKIVNADADLDVHWNTVNTHVAKVDGLVENLGDWLEVLSPQYGHKYDSLQPPADNIRKLPKDIQELALCLICLSHSKPAYANEIFRIAVKTPHYGVLAPLIDASIELDMAVLIPSFRFLRDHPDYIQKWTNLGSMTIERFSKLKPELMLWALDNQHSEFFHEDSRIRKESDPNKIERYIKLTSFAPLPYEYHEVMAHEVWLRENPEIHRLLSSLQKYFCGWGDEYISLEKVTKNPARWKRLLEAARHNRNLSEINKDPELLTLFDQLGPYSIQIERKMVADILAILYFKDVDLAKRILKIGVAGQIDQMHRLLDLAGAGYLPEVRDLLDKPETPQTQQFLKQADSVDGQKLVRHFKGEVEPVPPAWIAPDGKEPTLAEIDAQCEDVLKAIASATFESESDRHFAEETAVAIVLAKNLVAPNGHLRGKLIPLLRNITFIKDKLPANSDLRHQLNFVFDCLEKDPNFSHQIASVKKPIEAGSPSQALIRGTLKLGPDANIEDHHARIIVLSALLSRPRQSDGVGSCFGTQSNCLYHSSREYLLKSAKDYSDLVSLNRLERIEYGKVPKIVQYPLTINRKELAKAFPPEHPLVKGREQVFSSMSGADTSSLLNSIDLFPRISPSPFREILRTWFERGLPFALKMELYEVRTVFKRALLENASIQVHFDQNFPGSEKVGVWQLHRRDTNAPIESLEQYQQFILDSIETALSEIAKLSSLPKTTFDSLREAFTSRVKGDLFPFYQEVIADEQKRKEKLQGYWIQPFSGGNDLVVSRVNEQRPQEVKISTFGFTNCEEGFLAMSSYLESRPWRVLNEYRNPESVMLEPMAITGHAMNLRPQAIVKYLRQYPSPEASLKDFEQKGKESYADIRFSKEEGQRIIKKVALQVDGWGVEPLKSIKIDRELSLSEIGEIAYRKLVDLYGDPPPLQRLRFVENAIYLELTDEQRKKIPFLPFGDLNWYTDVGHNNIYLGFGLGILSGKPEFFRGTYGGTQRYRYQGTLETAGWKFNQTILREEENSVTYERLDKFKKGKSS